MACSTTSFPTTFGGSTDFKTCPLGFTSGSTGSTFGGFPGSFGGFGGSGSSFGGFPSTFGGFGGFPSTWGSGFGGFPSTWGSGFGGFPSTFGGFGGFPSTWGREGTFGGFPSTFGGFGGFPSTFGGFGGFPSTWGREGSFGGFPALESGSGWSNAVTPFGGNTFGGSSLWNVNFRPTSYAEYYSLTHPIRVLDAEGNRKLWLCYELKGFKPEEVCVTFDKKERAVIVEGTHDIKEGKDHHITRKFYRKFVLPETLAKIDFSTFELKSYFNAEGFLIVEGCLPKMTTEELARYPASSWARNTWGTPSTFGGFGGFGGFGTDARSIAVKTI